MFLIPFPFQFDPSSDEAEMGFYRVIKTALVTYHHWTDR
jgi:hypothetical protein